MNLGMSTNFGPVDLENLPFPATMKVDYIRIYQDPDNINYGCDPDDFPTSAYIKQCVSRTPLLLDRHTYLFSTGMLKRTQTPT